MKYDDISTLTSHQILSFFFFVKKNLIFLCNFVVSLEKYLLFFSRLICFLLFINLWSILPSCFVLYKIQLVLLCMNNFFFHILNAIFFCFPFQCVFIMWKKFRVSSLSNVFTSCSTKLFSFCNFIWDSFSIHIGCRLILRVSILVIFAGRDGIGSREVVRWWSFVFRSWWVASCCCCAVISWRSAVPIPGKLRKNWSFK